MAARFGRDPVTHVNDAELWDSAVEVLRQMTWGIWTNRSRGCIRTSGAGTARSSRSVRMQR